MSLLFSKSPRSLGKGCQGWWSLEILLASTITILVVGAGLMTLYQLGGVSNGLFPRNQIEQVQLTRMLLTIEDDFYEADRVYSWNNKKLTDDGHLVTDVTLPVVQSVPSPSASDFFTAWQTAHPTLALADEDANNKYSTLVFLKGGNQILSIVYLISTQNSEGVTYSLERYIPFNSTLELDSSFVFTAGGATFASQDQGIIFPSIEPDATVPTQKAELKLPVAFSKALANFDDGAQARRVKYSGDEWGTFIFRAENAKHWDVTP